jgi:choline dehydrogenase-like flavoprotein
MGNDPETSVVTPDLKAHDVDNLFIVGSGVFVTGGGVQPSLTIATLAIRAAEYLAREF